MFGDSQPLIQSNNNNTTVGAVKKVKYSNWLSTLLYVCILGLAAYFAYPYILQSNKGRLDPSRIAAVTVENGYSAEAQEDLITYLPKLEEDMSFNMFSGYLTVDEDAGRELFYWFEESQSDSADMDPLVLWTNGGPGCSGLVGKLTEHGAYWVYDDLSLKSNPYAWNTMANMLYIEQPYGVGFSVTSDDDDVVTGDDNAVSDIDSLVRSFLTKFPKYQNVEFYLASESYGGHYVPLTAKKILENNDAGLTPSISLKGFLVGNPLSSYYHNEEGFMSALYGHGLIKESIYNSWVEKCYGNEHKILYSTSCEVLYVKAYMASYDADVYALDYPTCTMDSSDLQENNRDESKFTSERKQFHNRAQERAKALLEKEDELKEHFDNDMDLVQEFQAQIEAAVESTSVPYLSCNTYYLVDYLNLDEVQEALHVKSMSSDWDYCSDDVFDSWPDTDWISSMKDTYLTLVNDYDIKMLVYSGDDDSVCALQGTMTFMSELGLTTDSTYDWSEWSYDDQLAGFYTKYLDDDGNTAIHFQTVRSAGHMVPTTQPDRALELFSRFFNYYD